MNRGERDKEERQRKNKERIEYINYNDFKFIKYLLESFATRFFFNSREGPEHVARKIWVVALALDQCGLNLDKPKLVLPLVLSSVVERRGHILFLVPYYSDIL